MSIVGTLGTGTSAGDVTAVSVVGTVGTGTSAGDVTAVPVPVPTYQVLVSASDVTTVSDVDDVVVITGVCGLETGTCAGDVMVVSDVNDVSVTKGVGDVETGTGAGVVTTLSDVDGVEIITGVCNMAMGTSGGDVTAVSDVDDVVVTTGVCDVGTGTSSGGVTAMSGVDDDGDMMRYMSGVGNVAVMTGVADVTEMADPDDVTGLVRAGDVDAIETGGSETQEGEKPSGPPGWAVFRRLPPLLLRGGLRAIFNCLSRFSRVKSMEDEVVLISLSSKELYISLAVCEHEHLPVSSLCEAV